MTSLAEVVSGLGWRQFHVAETEKYAHVTYFLNGGVEAAWPGEERLLVPSPRVATYDLEPQMSAAGVTDALVAAIESDRYDFIVANFANPDMVGHTGRVGRGRGGLRVPRWLPRTGRRCGAGRGRGVDAAGRRGALLAVTADHGNADVMRDANGDLVTAHSLNPVPFLLAGSPAAGLDACAMASWPMSRRRCSRSRASPPAPGMTGDLVMIAGGADILSARPTNLQESPVAVELILFIALVLVSVGLIAAILLQSRGAGLGATFGGESSVYRSRRGVEKRGCYQFTVVLAVLFVIVSLLRVHHLALVGGPAAAGPDARIRSSPCDRRDRHGPCRGGGIGRRARFRT